MRLKYYKVPSFYAHIDKTTLNNYDIILTVIFEFNPKKMTQAINKPISLEI
jgi:hypothetical protein